MARQEMYRISEEERQRYVWLSAQSMSLMDAVEGGATDLWPELREARIAVEEFEHDLIEKYLTDLDDVDYVSVSGTMGVIYSEDF